MHFGGFPNPNNGSDVTWYRGNVTTDLLDWKTWHKPPGKNMCQILAWGAGGGGGGGQSGGAVNKGGGGGGGASAQFSWIGPMFALPDTMYIQTGRGGLAGIAAGAGGLGVSTRIAIGPVTTNLVTDHIMFITGGGGGGAGAAGAGGAAGGAGTVPVMSNNPLAGLGQTQFFVGQVGAVGGASGAIGLPATIPTNGIRTMGGSGGAGVASGGASFAGGIITAIATGWLSEHAPAGAAAGLFNGSGGHIILAPFWSWCGLGGGSGGDAVNGGAGGPGAHGSGGGGGGGGLVGGVGGAGGNGLVIITCW